MALIEESIEVNERRLSPRQQVHHIQLKGGNNAHS